MAKLSLEDFIPVAKLPRDLIVVPSFIQGDLREAFLPAYEQARRGNNYFAFENGAGETGELRGSNVFMTGLANYVFAQAGAKLRTPVPTDDIYGKNGIFPMIENQLYSDLNAFDVWQTKPSYDKNKGIWTQLHELAEAELGRTPKGTFRIQGFYCLPSEGKNDYNIEIKPAENFKVIEDDKLDLPTGTKFNSLDENGIVVPDKQGKLTKYTLGNGVSRVFADSDGELCSDDDGLQDSDTDGREVVVGK